jgi:hypothetical protein
MWGCEGIAPPMTSLLDGDKWIVSHHGKEDSGCGAEMESMALSGIKPKSLHHVARRVYRLSYSGSRYVDMPKNVVCIIIFVRND